MSLLVQLPFRSTQGVTVELVSRYEGEPADTIRLTLSDGTRVIVGITGPILVGNNPGDPTSMKAYPWPWDMIDRERA
jgi:hypothetical protein